MPDRLPPRPAAVAGLALHTALIRAAHALLPSEVAAWRHSTSFFTSRLLGAFVALGIPDALDERPATAADLAARLDLHADTLHRLLRALALDGVVRTDRRGRFRLTRIGRRLRTHDARSLAAWVAYLDRPATQDAWAGVGDSVRTGAPSFEAVHDRTVWAHFAEHPDEEREFATAMRSLTAMVAPSVVHGFPWPDRGTVCDVAGGVGTLLSAVLLARPDLRGVLVDGPGVLREAGPYLAERGLTARVELSEGDIFTRVDAAADVYLLKDVLHDWDDERCRTILRTVRAAMPAATRVLLVETVQERAPDAIASRVDVHMLTQCAGGRQRSVAELQALLAEAGLRPATVTRTAGPALVEAYAA